MAAVTAAYTFVTWRIVRATRLSVEEQQLTRRAQYRPVVWADIDIDAERHVAFFVLSNTGASTARNVRFAIDPPFINPANPELSLSNDLPLMRRGIDVMVPGKALRTLVGVYGDFPLDETSRHGVTVDYDDELGNHYREPYELDLEALKGLAPSPPQGIHSLVNEIEKMNKILAAIKTALSATPR